MTYIWSLFIDRSVCLLGSYCVRVTENRPTNSHLGGEDQTQRGGQVGRGIVSIPHGVGVLCGNFARVGWPTRPGLPRPCPILKPKPCLCPGGPFSVPGSQDSWCLPEARGEQWNGGLEICIQLRCTELLPSQANTP